MHVWWNGYDYTSFFGTFGTFAVDEARDIYFMCYKPQVTHFVAIIILLSLPHASLTEWTIIITVVEYKVLEEEERAMTSMEKKLVNGTGYGSLIFFSDQYVHLNEKMVKSTSGSICKPEKNIYKRRITHTLLAAPLLPMKQFLFSTI